LTVDARVVGLNRRAALLVLAAAPFALRAQTNVPPEVAGDLPGARLRGEPAERPIQSPAHVD